MSKIVYRPKPSKSRIHSRDEFELCYIRHKYFRKTLDNPTVDDMKPYKKIVENLALKTYRTYISIFRVVGFEYDDIVSIGMIHLVSFLGLFSLESVPDKYTEFAETYKKNKGTAANPLDFLNKNRANFTMFLKQRMEDVVRICKQKARNIKGLPVEYTYFFCGNKRPPVELKLLLDDHESLGYKKIDPSSFRTVKNKAKKGKEEVFKYLGKWYISVPVDHGSLGLIDFSGAGLDPYDNMHNMDPERILFHREQEVVLESKKEDFRAKPKEDREYIVAEFLKNNVDNPDYAEEVKIAKRYLRKLGATVE